jgi:drug/metabolite transporter (DMT)-like permease
MKLPMIIACAQLALAMALVGANVVVARVLAQALPIPLLLFLRCLLACLVLVPFAGIMRPGAVSIRGQGLNFALQAALGTVLYNVALLAGLRRTGALEAGLVLATLPAVVATGAFLLLGERLSPRRWFAVTLAVGGMAALTVGRTSAGAGGTLAGDGLVFLAVCGEAGYVLLSKRMSAQIGVTSAAFWMQAFSALFLLPLAAPSFGSSALTGMGWEVALLLVFHSVTASVLCLLLWYRGMRAVPANLAGVFTALLPATAGLLAIVALGEAATLAHMVGFSLLLVSILLATPA